MKIFLEFFCLSVATLLIGTVVALVWCGTIIVDKICQLILIIINFFKKIFKIFKK